MRIVPRALRVCVLGLLAIAALWAGREFRARPGERVVGGELLVKFRRGTPEAAVTAALPQGSRSRHIRQLNVYVVHLPPSAPAGFSTALANHPLVEYVSPNRILQRAVRNPNDTSFGEQWPLTNVQAIKAWTLMPARYFTSSTTGTGRVKVAVIDSGADCTHPDFKNAGGASTDSAQGGQIAWSLSKAWVPTTLHPAACPWLDDFGHGTHVGGTVLAATNNAVGVASLGYPLEMVVHRVLDETGNGSEADVAGAMVDSVDNGAKVINMSLAGPGYFQVLQDALNYAWEHNVVVIASAGNDNTNALVYPAGGNYAIGVAAVDAYDVKAGFSNWGESVDIAAPGDGILSLAPTQPGTTLGAIDYATFSGTSMAAPHVAALAGVLAMTTPNLSAAAIGQRLQQAADSTIANGGWNQDLGYGRLNAWRAVAGSLRAASVGGIIGQVADAAGLPVEAATVTVGSQNFTTSTSGLFRFSNLTPGIYNVAATAAGFPARALSATVVPGADNTVTILMGGGFGTITGTVTNAGLPVAGAVVQALAAGLVKATSVTHTNGQYSLSVAPGSYDVQASALSSITATVAAPALAADATVTANISLSKMGVITGVVRGPGGLPLPNAQIAVTGPNFTAGAITDVNGTYTTIGLPPGSYNVTASAWGYQDASVSGISVSTDQASTADLQLSYLPTGFPPIRVNAGGSSFTDPQGRLWGDDSSFVGGTTFSTTSAINGTDAPTLYQTLRFGSFRYEFEVANGSYTVNLKFAELYFQTAGQRVFNILINGQTVLTNFDVVAQAGAALTAVDRAFTVNVTTGQIVIQSSGVLNEPAVNAIEITPVTVTPSTPVLAASQTQQFTAAVSGATNTAVTWSLSPPVGTISSTGLYTAPATVATTQKVLITATSTINSASSASATLTLVSGGPIRVNSGGSAYTDPLGRVWTADTRFFGGSVSSTTTAITGTSTPALYQNVRYGSFRYEFLLPNGSYTANLKFAEITFSTAGQRVFHVLINGQTVLSNFDAVAQAGGAFKAVDKQIPVDVTGGQIVIQFTAVVNQPSINAIEIVPQSPVSVAMSPTSATLGPSQTQQFTATVTGTSNTAVTWSLNPVVGAISNSGLYTAPGTVSTAQTVTVIAASDADPNSMASAAVTLLPGGPVRVNSGGPAYTDPMGRVWSADTGYIGGGTYSTTASISGTSAPALYQNVRHGSFRYEFAVPNGSHTVNLKFAEIFFTQTGQRVFHVLINGQTVLSSFDAVAQAGGAFKAVDRQIPVDVSGGQIVVQFTAVVNVPSINAIEIYPRSSVSVALSPTSATLGPSQTQQFTATVTGTTNIAVTWQVIPAVGTISSSGLYTAPATVSTAQTVTVTATSVADPNSVASAAVTLLPGGPVRVNSGGPAYTDPMGRVWSADTGFVGGSTYSTTASISGTITPALYQNVRHGSFQYQFPAPNGAHTVNLKFAEIFYTQAGQRVFHVAINGQTVLSSFDAVAQAGGAFKAVDRSFPVDVTNGQVGIQFTAVVNQPSINAIEILPQSSVSVAVNPTSTTLGPSQAQQFTATVTGTSNTAVTWSLNPLVGTISSSGLYTAPATVSTSQTVMVTATSVADPNSLASATVTLLPGGPVRVNSGGPAYTDPMGRVWSADTGFVGGSTYSTSASISGTTTPALYQNVRYGSFQYQFPVPNGAHTVNLKFAEVFFTQAGQRVFHVTINGQTVLSNFDAVALAGPKAAIDRSLSVDVTGGRITIEFVRVTGDPSINAIEILP